VQKLLNNAARLRSLEREDADRAAERRAVRAAERAAARAAAQALAEAAEAEAAAAAGGAGGKAPKKGGKPTPKKRGAAAAAAGGAAAGDADGEDPDEDAEPAADPPSVETVALRAELDAATRELLIGAYADAAFPAPPPADADADATATATTPRSGRGAGGGKTSSTARGGGGSKGNSNNKSQARDPAEDVLPLLLASWTLLPLPLERAPLTARFTRDLSLHLHAVRLLAPPLENSGGGPTDTADKPVNRDDEAAMDNNTAALYNLGAQTANLVRGIATLGFA
jgi:hypothetical protein